MTWILMKPSRILTQSHSQQNRQKGNTMKIWKLVSGILSIVLFVFVSFQSCAAGLANSLEENGEISGSAGLIVAVLMLVGGIVSIVTRQSEKKGGNIALFILFGLAALIGFAGSAIQTSTVVQDRYQGYLDALSEYNIHPNSAWTFDGVYRLEGGVQTANQLIQMHNRPTAMITSEDLIACGIIQGYQENGLSVPKDISVVGFDNSIPSTVVTPKLTTINQFMRKKAECAVEMLLHAM